MSRTLVSERVHFIVRQGTRRNEGAYLRVVAGRNSILTGKGWLKYVEDRDYYWVPAMNSATRFDMAQIAREWGQELGGRRVKLTSRLYYK